jgi:hypothetical protein
VDISFVGVKEYASDWIYSISLFSTTTAVPINGPSLDKLPSNAGIGMFRGTDYFDHHRAMENFASQFKVNKVGSPAKVDANGVMKQYQTGQQYILNGSTNYTSPQTHHENWLGIRRYILRLLVIIDDECTRHGSFNA